MQIYAFKRARLAPDTPDAELARQISMTPQTICNWKNVDGFSEWLEHQIAIYNTPIQERLEQVALEQIKDFRYWEAMSKKHAFISDKNEPLVPPTTPLAHGMTREQAKLLLMKLLETPEEPKPPEPQEAKPADEPSSSE